MAAQQYVIALAGGLAGVATDALLFPLDTLKTRLQARRVGGPSVGSPPTAWLPRVSAASYSGLAAALLGGFPAAATFWVVYELAKARIAPLVADAPGGLACVANGAAAAVAECAVCAVRNPFEVVKQQVQAGLYAGSGAALRGLLREGGPLGLYRGSLPTLLRDVAFNVVQYSLYEDWKALQRGERQDLLWWENTALGGAAGGLAAAATTPLDVVKTRLMTQARPLLRAAAPTAPELSLPYRGVGDALTRIAREEGWRTLFAGVRPRVVSIACGGAIFIGSFEEFRRRLS